MIKKYWYKIRWRIVGVLPLKKRYHGREKLINQFARYLYHRFLPDEMYIPSGGKRKVALVMIKYPRVFGDKFGEPRSIRLSVNGQETYFSYDLDDITIHDSY